MLALQLATNIGILVNVATLLDGTRTNLEDLIVDQVVVIVEVVRGGLRRLSQLVWKTLTQPQFADHHSAPETRLQQLAGSHILKPASYSPADSYFVMFVARSTHKTMHTLPNIDLLGASTV